ncbi:response regulator [Candidatus Peregrinibacteria bacterium]|nr:response regulator [Candidatus Peregrinibacteria bacterium]
MTNVLVAEDEKFLRDIIQMSLLDHAIEVRVASNGKEAIDAVEEEVPQLLLLDLLMPRVDGYAVLRHIRERGYDFPVVILSNLGDPLEEEKCMKLGVKDFIIKSNLDEDQLWEKIEKYLVPAHGSV